MKPVTEENRISAYREAPEDIRTLYASEQLSSLIASLHATYEVAAAIKQFSDIVGDTILGFYKVSDLPRLFQQKLNLSADESQRITSKLIETLTPAVKREEEEAEKKKAALQTLTQTFTKPAAAPVQEVPQEYTGGVEPIRTMEQDMSRVHGYGAYREQIEKEEEKIISSQDDLLKKN
jgi:hypothetical protein